LIQAHSSEEIDMPKKDPQSKDYGLNLVRDLKLPPAGFNVLTASERELQIYGLPRRPDADKHPKQAALWDSFAARSLRFVRPTLVPLQDPVRSGIRDYKVHELTSDLELRDVLNRRLSIIGIRLCWIRPLTSTNWSGFVVNRPASEQLVTVTGQWVVPNVSPPASAWNGKSYNDGTYICAVWVGLDGWGGTNDVLQAGTNSVVVVSRGVVTSRSYYAWIEWFGNPWQVESDFPVSPGDAILCTVCAPFGNAHGTAMFTNQTTGLATNYGIDPPANVTLVGNVAEWIVEDPTQSNGSLFPFPNYGLTAFHNCGAGSKDISLNLNDACPINLVDGSGNVRSESGLNSATSMTCNFLS
jgi:Peptidase A4 family